MTLNAIEISTAEAHAAQFRAEVLARSNGLLNDFSVASILRVLEETYALGFTALELQTNEKITNVVFQSVAKLLGATDFQGVQATITLEFLPYQIDMVNDLRVSSGYRVTINGQIFETLAEMQILAGRSSGQVLAQALDAGSAGNVPSSAQVSFAPIPGIRVIQVVGDPVVLGKDTQSFDQVSVNLTNEFVNRALITTRDYQALLAIEFPDLLFKAVANLGADKVTVAPGSMHIFGISSLGTELTSSQKNAIAATLSDGWATVFVSPFTLYPFKISCICKPQSGQDEATLAGLIKTKLNGYYEASLAVNRSDIDLYDTIAQVYTVPGVQQIGYLSFDQGDGQWQAIDIPMPNIFTIPKLEDIKVTFNSGNVY